MTNQQTDTRLADMVDGMRAEVDRLREVERKAIAQSEYIQARGLTEYEFALVRQDSEQYKHEAEVARVERTDARAERDDARRWARKYYRLWKRAQREIASLLNGEREF